MVVGVLNLALPGSGLVARDRLGPGLPLLVIAATALVVILAAGLIATPGFAAQLRWAAVAAYLASALVAGLLWLAWERRRPWDGDRVIEYHRATAAAYLAGDHQTALAQARALTRIAGGSAGAWELLAMVCDAAGDPAAARRARRQAREAGRRAA